MKPRLHIVLPPRANILPAPGSRGRLPLVLVPVLAGMAAVQLAMPERIGLPPGGSVARIGAVAPPATPTEVIAPSLPASRDPFALPAPRGGPDDAGDPLGGAVIAGVVQKGRLRLGVIQQTGGQVRYVAVGGDVAGWRLAALDGAAARLTHGPGHNLLVPYGLHPTPTGNAAAPPTGTIASPPTLESGQ